MRKSYTRALMLDSNSINTYLNRGISYTHVEEYLKAINDFNSVIQLEPQNADAFNNRGLVYSSLKDHRKAITNFDKALDYYFEGLESAKKKNVSVYIAILQSNIASLKRKLGKYEEAKLLYK